MKKFLIAILMASGLAYAVEGDKTSTVITPFQVNVSNVCTYKGGGSDVNGLTYTDPTRLLLNYTAVASSSATTDVAYEFRCTVDTAVEILFAGYNYEEGEEGPKLDVELVDVNADTATDEDGDTYTYRVKVTVPEGQWNVPAGQYDGNIVTTFNYH